VVESVAEVESVDLSSEYNEFIDINSILGTQFESTYFDLVDDDEDLT
jgi:hypothetical protein